ncbi:MAG: LysR family transcriptional regulator [Betaproteobacteria bacterium]
MTRSTLRKYFKHGMFPQLQVFEACARLGSFSRAADELCLAQPTVSCQMKKLNETVGIALFDMSGRPGQRVALTAAGKELLELCSGVFDQFGLFERRLAALDALTRRQLRIATTGNMQYGLTQALTQAPWRGSAPDATCEIITEVMNRRQMLHAMDSAIWSHDIYFFEDGPRENERAGEPELLTEISGIELCVMARHDHLLARRKQVRLQELAGQPWIFREPGSGTRDALDAHFAQTGFVAEVRMTLGSNDAIRAAILDGSGIGVLPAQMFRDSPEKEGLVQLAVETFPLRRRGYAMTPGSRTANAEGLIAALRVVDKTQDCLKR